MEVNVETERGFAILEPLGDAIDASNADDVREKLAALAQSQKKVILDLNRIQFADSSGCGAFVDGHKHCLAAGGELRICNLNPPVKTVVELARLNRILNLYDTLPDAMAGFGT